MPPNIFIPAIM